MPKGYKGFRRGHRVNAKLTPIKVREIREDYVNGATQGELARKHKVSVVQIGRIVRGEAWSDFYNPPHPSEIEDSLYRALHDPNVVPIMPSQEFIDRLAAEDAARAKLAAISEPLDAGSKARVDHYLGRSAAPPAAVPADNLEAHSHDHDDKPADESPQTPTPEAE